MKKSFIIFGLAAGALMLASCQKELTEGNAGTSVPQVTKTMYVEGNEWIPEDGTKTAYQPGQGVQWTGTETFAIYYGNSAIAGAATNDNKYMAKAGNVTSSGSGLHTFTHDAIDGAETYDYCVIVPDLNTTGTNGSGTAASFKLSPVQTPGTDTYDPNYDILLGQGAQQVTIETELEITNFKRLTAPLRLTITDGAGILGNEKIYAVTLRFNQAIEEDKGMAGTGYLNFAYEYDACKVNSITAPSNTVTAVYAEGLQKSGEGWPVWYSVYPFASTGDMTVTVTTETKTLVRTIPAAGASILANQLNGLTFDISGSGYTESESLYWDFTALDAIAPQQVASDGKSYNWGFANCTVWNGGDATGQLPSSLRANANGGEITLPTIAGKQITKIRLYAHPNNAQSADNKITLNAGTAHAFSSYADNGETLNSGVLEITVPETEYGQPLVLKAGAALAAFDGIAVELTDAELEPADENDYYTSYLAGNPIIINGVEYSVNEYPAILKKTSELKSTDVQIDAKANGIIFLEPDAPVTLATFINSIDCNLVIIGRYKDNQPQINLTGQIKLRGYSATFKNIHFVAQHQTSMINAEYKEDAGYSSPKEVTLEDCNIDMTASRILVQDVANDASLQKVNINNCTIEYNATASKEPALFMFNSARTLFGPLAFSMTNTVVYAAAPVKAFIADFGSKNEKFAALQLDVNVSNNTFYNVYSPSVLIRTYNAKSFVVKDNVGYFVNENVETAPVKSYLTAIYSSFETAEVTGNYLYTNFVSGSNFWSLRHTGTYSTDGNFLHNPATDCIVVSDVNLESGYVPVNTTVVTNGAGADYDTKYWVQK